MNLEKRIAYCNNNTEVGIHTGNGASQDIVDLDKVSTINFIENCNIRKVRYEDKKETYMRINPNRNNRGYILKKYSEFEKLIQQGFK